MLERLLLPELRQAVADGDWAEVNEFCSALHPSVAAQILSELDAVDQVKTILDHVDLGTRTTVFEFLSAEKQDALVVAFPWPELATILERMSHDERADLVKRMDEEHQALVMPLVARKEREDILRLVSYEEDTAGAIMTTDYAALPADLTAAEAISRLRQIAPDRETIYYIYVVDAERRLIGFVSLKDLILAPPQRTVEQIMQKDILFVRVDMDVEDVAADLARYDVLALPVVDAEQKLVGIVTHDDIIDVVIEEATEDAHRMGAMQPLDTGYFSSPFWLTVRKRVVWLLVLFGAQMLSAVVLDWNGSLLTMFTTLFIFLPVIIATGGNTGSQSATLITRALALGEVAPRDWRRIALRELFSGLALGGVVGLLGILTTFAFGESRYAVILLTSLILVTTSGAMIGSLMPLVFERVGWDPAISSSPFVASVVDVIGIGIFCGIAVLVLY